MSSTDVSSGQLAFGSESSRDNNNAAAAGETPSTSSASAATTTAAAPDIPSISVSNAPPTAASDAATGNSNSSNGAAAAAATPPTGASGRTGTARLAITATLFRRRPPAFPNDQQAGGGAGGAGQAGGANRRGGGGAAAGQPQQVGGGAGGGTVRERLFYALFVRMALTYARLVPPPMRRLIEFLVLVKALAFLFVLSYIHYTLTMTPASCLNHVKNSWPRDGVLRVLITKNLQPMVIPDPNYNPYEYDIGRAVFAAWPGDGVTHYNVKYVFLGPHDQFYEAYERSGGHLYEWEPPAEPEPLPEAVASAENVTIRSTENATNVSTDADGNSIEEFLIDKIEAATLPSDAETSGSAPTAAGAAQTAQEDEEYLQEMRSDEQLYDYAVEYSLEYGFLRLSTKTRERLRLPVMTVVLNPDSDSCFGDELSKFILSELLGYEDVLMSSVKLLAEGETHKGYLRDLMTGEHYRFIDVGSTRLFYIAAFLIMIVFTFGISMLLRFSHHQIFLFIIDLLQLFEMNQAVALPAAPLLTVILALVGMEAIMSEFFNETSTAFYVIMMVWVGDQYDAICCHSPISRRYWLRFFYLYQFAFYAYTYRFNGQYNGLALLSSWLFIQHSMIYFFHHYEIPLILHEHRVQRLLQGLHDGTFDVAVNNNNTNNNNNNNSSNNNNNSNTANSATNTTASQSSSSSSPAPASSSQPDVSTATPSSTTAAAAADVQSSVTTSAESSARSSQSPDPPNLLAGGTAEGSTSTVQTSSSVD